MGNIAIDITKIALYIPTLIICTYFILTVGLRDLLATVKYVTLGKDKHIAAYAIIIFIVGGLSNLVVKTSLSIPQYLYLIVALPISITLTVIYLKIINDLHRGKSDSILFCKRKELINMALKIIFYLLFLVSGYILFPLLFISSQNEIMNIYIFVVGYVLSLFLGGIINTFACLFELKEYVIYSSKFKKNKLFEDEGEYFKLCGFIIGEIDNFIIVTPKGKKPIHIDKSLIEIIIPL